MTTTYDVMPERGFIETYYILDDAHDVADGMEVSGDGPVQIWANTAVGRVRLR
jgi:hypothetical protein